MPLFVTLLVAKTLLRLSRMLGRGGGSALPGLVAEKLDPQIAGKLGRSLPEGVIVVTGTNGKTTTTKMLAAIFQSQGKHVISNKSGSNLSRGVTSSLIEAAGLTGRLSYQLGIFEVDEASMPAVCAALDPKAVVVLNLFRDQLDRYGELDKTARYIGLGIEAAGTAQVYLNADDPLVASLESYVTKKADVHYFGVEAEQTQKLEHDLAADSNHCPLCGLALDYTRNFFSHLGHYSCPREHFDRPYTEASLTGLQLEQAAGSKLVVLAGARQAKLSLPLPGLYNAYNALGALVAAVGQGIDLSAAAKALETVSAAFGRVELVTLNGRRVYLLLIKNPTGFNQVIQTFLLGPAARRRNVLVAINDNFADGRDVSWLWDVAFEDLAGQNQAVIASGIRASDLALRLKYAEIDSQVEEDLKRAVKRLVAATPVGETAYLLPTYTAMLALRQIITREAKLEGFWK